jgi:signal transduction histidine kinase/DNA-binding response OmpR family regulator/CHASE3 domain sensor protein
MTGFKRNLLIGYSISLLLLLISSIASYISIRNLLDAQRMVGHTNEVLRNLDLVYTSVREGEARQRGFLLSGDSTFLDGFQSSYNNSLEALQKVETLTADNSQQISEVDTLELLLKQRFQIMNVVLDEKRQTGNFDLRLFEKGRELMSGLTAVARRMQQREQSLLQQRSEKQSRFATYTPSLIILASMMGIIVTIISFLRVTKDFERRKQLHEQLAGKNADISRRIHIIEDIAARISGGDFSTRVSEHDKESLGVLAGSLNKMAESLEISFNDLADQKWQQTGVAELNELMIGENDLQTLTMTAIRYVVQYTGSSLGAFYLAKDDSTLELSASINLDTKLARKQIRFGEGVAGQSALIRKQVLVQPVADAEVVIDYTGGSLKPKAIVAIPVTYENRFKGVMELAALHEYSAIVQQFLRTAAFNIGLAIHSARDHQRLQELLAETQAQSEELQSQHSELENVNSELEAQAEKLQASEEELKVQQEELQQANQELEERSRLLEERNELILERNLDIQRKAEQLALSTRYKSEFLANMSHELRTPLNSILLLSRLLSENHGHNLSEDQIEYANVIQSSGKGLLTLIDEILDLTKIESGKMELELGDVHLDTLAKELDALFAPLAKDKGISFSIDINEKIPPAFESDRLRLEQILRNLISNALKFTKRGSVEVKFTREADNLLFSVKDTGIGIPQEKHQTIFEAFQQADGSTRREFGGTGLGLSISRELAKLLGGEIKLASEEGKGSEFTLVLPLKRMEGPKSGESESKDFSDELEAFPTSPDLKTRRADNRFLSETIPPSLPDDRDDVAPNEKSILIIEDDTAFAKSLLDYTRANGYKGIIAVRGDEGVELARRFLPTGILLDIQLPVKSGWEVMEELKSDKRTRPIPVHMMSSHEVRTKSLSKGAVDFINKPVAFEKLGEIFKRIENALSRHPKKVLIVEENPKHAQALAYFLGSYDLNAEIKNSVDEGIQTLKGSEVDCVILDMGIPAQRSYEMLEDVKKTPGLEQVPIIVFTGKNLSHVEEMKIRQYADSIVVKTAQSYQRILDEVSLFLHLVEENNKEQRPLKYRKMGELSEVLKDKTILVADDDVRNIFSLSRSLENYGVNVVSAIDGKDALLQLEANGKVDLVLMDMMMPEMDGYESTRRIREIPKYRNLPIIAVTAKAMTGDREKCIAAGASDYITKPVDVDQLTSLLRVWLYQ